MAYLGTRSPKAEPARLAAVVELTPEAWRFAGRSFPTHTRATMPIALGTLQDQFATT